MQNIAVPQNIMFTLTYTRFISRYFNHCITIDCKEIAFPDFNGMNIAVHMSIATVKQNLMYTVCNLVYMNTSYNLTNLELYNASLLALKTDFTNLV